MSKNETIVTADAAAVSETPKPPRKRRKKRAGRIIKRIIGFLILFAVIGGIGYYVYTLFQPKETVSEALSEMVYRGSIQSMVTGSGMTKAQESASVTLTAGGEVLEVFVAEGQWVNKGDPLYIIDSKEAVEAVTNAETARDDVLKRIAKIYEYYDKLTVKAPFAGKLIDAAAINIGNSISEGSKIAAIVDDSFMKLTLYFSYGYFDSVSLGQEADVSIPAVMETLKGRVTEIHRVERISNEGTKLFEVVIEVANPGTLTEGMSASASLADSQGNAVYAYEAAKLEYKNIQIINAGATGNVLTKNLINYSKVEEGQVLLTMDDSAYDKQLETLNTELETAVEKVKNAQKALDNYQAVAPMSGTVLSCALQPGKTVAAGTVAVNIADTSTMTVQLNIDEINISYVKPGMMCNIIQWGRNGQQNYMGTIEYVSMQADNSSGVAVFPATVTVANPDGSLLTGMYVDYNLVAAQSDNCLIAPVQAVKYTEAGTVVFVKADTAPENAIDISQYALEVPEGYYAVPVEIGLSDDYGVEIISGVEEGAQVFTQYMKTSADSYSKGGW
jgi:multidrug efflux pump subunit AcrA (membrane-fusion protein)